MQPSVDPGSLIVLLFGAAADDPPGHKRTRMLDLNLQANIYEKKKIANTTRIRIFPGLDHCVLLKDGEWDVRSATEHQVLRVWIPGGGQMMMKRLVFVEAHNFDGSNYLNVKFLVPVQYVGTSTAQFLPRKTYTQHTRASLPFLELYRHPPSSYAGLERKRHQTALQSQKNWPTFTAIETVLTPIRTQNFLRKSNSNINPTNSWVNGGRYHVLHMPSLTTRSRKDGDLFPSERLPMVNLFFLRNHICLKFCLPILSTSTLVC